MEDGQLKPVYDPEDLKRWKIKKGLPLTDDTTPESTTTPPRDDAVSLLPVRTGGHAHPAAAPSTDPGYENPSFTQLEAKSKPMSTADRRDNSRLPPQAHREVFQGEQPREDIHYPGYRRESVEQQDQQVQGTSYVPAPSQRDRQPDYGAVPDQHRRSEHPTHQPSEPPLRNESRHVPVPQLPPAAPRVIEAPPQVQRPRPVIAPRPAHGEPWAEPRRQSDSYNQGGAPRERDTWAEPRRRSDNFYTGDVRPRESYREAGFIQSSQHIPYHAGQGQHEPAGDRHQQRDPRQFDAPRVRESAGGGHYQQAEMPRHNEPPRVHEPAVQHHQLPQRPQAEVPRYSEPLRAYEPAGQRSQPPEPPQAGMPRRDNPPRAQEPAGERYQHAERPRAYEPPRGGHQPTEPTRHRDHIRAYEPADGRYQHAEPPRPRDAPRSSDQDHQAESRSPAAPAAARNLQSQPPAASQPIDYDAKPPRHDLNPDYERKAPGRKEALGWSPSPAISAGAPGPPQPGPPQTAAPAQPTSPAAREPPVTRDPSQAGDFTPPVHIPDREDSARTPIARQQDTSRRRQPEQRHQPAAPQARQPASRAMDSHSKEEHDHGESVWEPPPREPSVAPSSKSSQPYGGW